MQTFHIHIQGIVQGVGFRPFIYRLANELGLYGNVSNGSDGLHIVINSHEEEVQYFISLIENNAPPHSKIQNIICQETKAISFDHFEIVPSIHNKNSTAFCPDIATCDQCIKEMFDPNNRRYQYAFITCTQCGPRYSIMHSLPYDRENTSMHAFEMCDVCQAEYDDVQDKRYYSQTNSCKACGIQMTLKDNKGQVLSEDIDSIKRHIESGQIVAVKGIGGFLLLCDAGNLSAVLKLRERKHRPSKPLAVMVKDVAHAKSLVKMKDTMIQKLESSVAPIILANIADKSNGLICYEAIAPQLDSLGIMLPNTGLLHLIMHSVEKPLICTSANTSGSPIVYEEAEMHKSLSHVYDVIVSHNRKIVVPQDDSVVRFTALDRRQIILRRSRGLAPNVWMQDADQISIQHLAVGGDVKNTIAVSNGDQVFVSQFLGDQASYQSQCTFESMYAYINKTITPTLNKIFIDKHPDYKVNQTADRLWSDTNKVKVQHHHAHMYAIMGEHHLLTSQEQVRGFIWDGVGYGDDGAVWGGEVFDYEDHQMKRKYYFDYFPYFMGDKMSNEPRLAAFSLLKACQLNVDIIKPMFKETAWLFYHKQWDSSNHSNTSSIGRIFDGLAALLGLCAINGYEGHGALLLEQAAQVYFEHIEWSCDIPSYPFYIKQDNIIDWHPMVESIVEDKMKGEDVYLIAAKFHLTLVNLIERLSIGMRKIVFSGGVFQNAVLVQLIDLKMATSFNLYFHEQLSPNDENISFGQLINSIHYKNQTLCA